MTVETAIQLSKRILEETKVPMSSKEIWDYAVSKGYDKNTALKGKTPERTLGAQIYTNIQNNGEKSAFVKVSSRPQKFGLKKIDYKSSDVSFTESDNYSNSYYSERDLHPLLVSFVNSDPHFQSRSKTIHHESSKKNSRNADKWIHPDIVSVRLPFDDLNEMTIELAKYAGIETIDIFSFELKKEINLENIRECYFQAVSNSSWANEGYLVAPKITEEAMDQLYRLNSSFGIGVIRLNVEDVHQSEVLIPSKDNDLDITAINYLSEINHEFNDFIVSINDSMRVMHFIDGKYDRVMSDEEMSKYIKDKRIQ